MQVNQNNRIAVEIEPLKLNQASFNEYGVEFVFDNNNVNESLCLSFPYRDRTSHAMEMKTWIVRLATAIVKAQMEGTSSAYVYTSSNEPTILEAIEEMRDAVRPALDEVDPY